MPAWVKLSGWIAAPVIVTVAAMIVISVLLSADEAFSASDWRRARQSRDFDAMEIQARRAVSDGDLLDLTGPELRQLLGDPDRVARRAGTWSWEMGFVNDYVGPGDQGALRVTFEGDRVTEADIG